MTFPHVVRFTLCLLLAGTLTAIAQESGEGATVPDHDVAVVEIATDEQIEARLTDILRSTTWFQDIGVEVRSGVVFLSGRTDTTEHREWAGRLGERIRGVVTVVNHITLTESSGWDLAPVRAEIRLLRERVLHALPTMLLAALIMILGWCLARGVSNLVRSILQRRRMSPMVVMLISRFLAIPVLLISIYLVLQIAGLTHLALTLLGGTGIMGIVMGFAFRDIAENFLASVLLSVRQPFRPDDLIEVAGQTGIVQRMNTRCTVLMTMDGNHVQIPNATIFKNTIVNYTANPNRRGDYVVGIGYDDSARQAQELVARLLEDHQAVLDSPEPMVLVESLGASTVNLRIYYWFDATRYSPPKLKSSLQRLTKRTLTDAQITMPDEAREIVFPQGVPVTMSPTTTTVPTDPVPNRTETPIVAMAREGTEPVSMAAEGELHSETEDVRKQARACPNPEEGVDLLGPA